MAAIALGQAFDELFGVGRPGGGDHLGVGSVRSAIADVVAHITGKQCGLLRHQRNMAAQLPQAELADIFAIEQYPALLGIVKSLQQLKYGRFAGPGRPHQRQAPARLDG